MSYQVALCGLSVKDRNLVEIVIARVPNPKCAFTVLKGGMNDTAHIAIIDADNPLGATQFQELRARNPSIVGVHLSDHGLMGASRYRIERKSLLLKVRRVLEEVVEGELTTNKVRPHPSAQTGTRVMSAASATPSHEAAFASAAPQTMPTRLEVLPLRALVVDDSLAVRDQLRSALERVGMQCDTAENAEQAIGLLRQHAYDVGFLDVVMPGIDGYELCRKIKHNTYTRSLPVMMLTSRSSPFDRARGALAGCDTYLVKPITWETFYEALDKTMTRHFGNDQERLAQRGYKISRAL